MATKVYPDRRPKSLRTKVPIQQSVEFTITKGNFRQKCVLRTTFLSSAHALSYFKTRRRRIEEIARQKLCDGAIDDDVIFVDMI